MEDKKGKGGVKGGMKRLVRKRGTKREEYTEAFHMGLKHDREGTEEEKEEEQRS